MVEKIMTILPVSIFMGGLTISFLYATLTALLGKEKTSDAVELMKQVRVYATGTMFMIIGIGLKLFFG